MDHIALLKNLGLDEKEARVYLAALEAGPSTVVTLAKKSGIKRTTIYEFINDMVARGLIVTSVSGKRLLYGAAEPKALADIIERQKEILAQSLPELVLIGQKSATRPRIRFYEGIDGLKHVYLANLDHPAGSEIISFSDFSEVYQVLPATFIDQFVAKKIRNQITSRVILSDDEYAKKHIKDNKKELRKSIVVSKEDFHVSNEISVCGNMTSIISFGDEKIAVVIESYQVAETVRQIFNLLWKNLSIEK